MDDPRNAIVEQVESMLSKIKLRLTALLCGLMIERGQSFVPFLSWSKLMQKKRISVSPSARKFMEERGIQDVTFNLKVVLPAGCCVGIIKEIEPVYEAVENASGYRYFQVEDRHVFVSREIKIIGPLTLNTEGLWRMKRLTLDGVTIPL
jgi:hypothetical protein